MGGSLNEENIALNFEFVHSKYPFPFLPLLPSFHFCSQFVLSTQDQPKMELKKQKQKQKPNKVFLIKL